MKAPPNLPATATSRMRQSSVSPDRPTDDRLTLSPDTTKNTGSSTRTLTGSRRSRISSRKAAAAPSRGMTTPKRKAPKIYFRPIQSVAYEDSSSPASTVARTLGVTRPRRW